MLWIRSCGGKGGGGSREEEGRKERKRKMNDLKYNDVLLSMDHKPG